MKSHVAMVVAILVFNINQCPFGDLTRDQLFKMYGRFQISNDDDVFTLRHRMPGNCSIKELDVRFKEFMLTTSDVELLKQCPVEELSFSGSKCLSPSVSDLTGLSQLTELYFTDCQENRDFVIRRLPASLEYLDLTDLHTENIQLSDSNADSRFSESLANMVLGTSTMCCPEELSAMFARNMAHVNCYPVHDTGVPCYGNKQLHVHVPDTVHINQDLNSSIPSPHREVCPITSFTASLKDYIFDIKDLLLLRNCPLKSLDVSSTRCLSESVGDLSPLSSLVTLDLSHCTNLDFQITDLPLSLRMMDLRGLGIQNIKLKPTAEVVTDPPAPKLRIVVSDPMMCCPHVVHQMFGNRRVFDNCLTPNYRQFFYKDLNLKIKPRMTLYEWYRAYRISKVGGVERAFITGISSCENLIGSPVLRGLVWAMAVSAFAGNALVILYRVVGTKACRGQSYWLFVVNLGMSDLLMGVYLIIIASATAQFSGEYALHDTTWRHGPVCQLAGVITTVSSETSAIFMLLVTLDRFVAIRFPLRVVRMSQKWAVLACCLGWLVGLVVAVVPVLMEWEVYSFNSICVGLPLNNEAYLGSKYAVGIFIGINSVIFVLIAIGQIAVFWAKRVSSTEIKASMSGQQAQRRFQEDLAIARYLAIIVLSDFCCWFPICVMGVLAQTGSDLASTDTDVYAWSAVVVMPINSAINPLLYTSPALTKLFHYFKC